MMKITENEKLRIGLTRLVMKNDGHCPCMVEQNEDTLCPCKWQREEEECVCGLYVKVEEE